MGINVVELGMHRNNPGIQYRVEGKTVYAEITGCQNDMINLARKWFRGDIPSWMTGLELPDKFVGKAFCADSDEFDEETGKEIAKARVIDKYDNALWNKIQFMYDTYTGPAIMMQGMCDSYMRKRTEISKRRWHCLRHALNK